MKKLLTNKKIKFPIVLKPVNEGSSLGVKIIKKSKYFNKIAQGLFKRYDQLILEEYIGGQEIQAAVLNKKALGAIELIPRRSFYDYKAKYNRSARTKHLMPARLKKGLQNSFKYC